jgi:DNA polymerase (family 10)
MALAAKTMKYEYILISDHTQSTGIAHGLNEQQMLKHLWNIKKAAKQISGIAILAGAEVDILPDGSLDYSDEILSQLDMVIASVHSSFKMPKEKMTSRIIKALQNKHVHILGHPTGRLLRERQAYEVDMEKVLQAAKRYNVAMELNANPHRLDLNDIHCKRAKELGVKIVISTDAHSIEQLKLMKYGILTARRGWLEAKDVLNTLTLAELKAIIKPAT